jgi:anti-sigma regulatory factor (Ser/Thr protein kinase)
MPGMAVGTCWVSCEFVGDPAEVGHARKQTRKALCDWGLGNHADLAALLVSEIVTNAICHGEGAARIGVSHADGHLRVEVHDDGAGRPVRRQPDTDDESGRGLALIDGLIELQGGERGMAEDGRGPGKTVYVVIRLPADGSDTRQ